MARYVKVIPVGDTQEQSFPEIRHYLMTKGFHETTLDGQQVFQKGDGIWIAARFVKISYFAGYARLEAWVDVMGSEEGLEGFVGCAAKGPIKKAVPVIEEILTRSAMPMGAATVRCGSEQNYCAKCGARLVEGQEYCGSCGYILGEPIRKPAGADAIPAGVHVTKQEYLKKYAGEAFYKNLKIAAIVGYVLCGLQGLMAMMDPYALIDVAICLGLTLGMHLGRSKGCAIGMLVYFAFSAVITLLSTGSLGGWGWLFVGIYALTLISNAEKQYKALAQN